MLVRLYANASIQKIPGVVNHQYQNVLPFNAKADMVIDTQMSEMRGYSLKAAVLQLP